MKPRRVRPLARQAGIGLVLMFAVGAIARPAWAAPSCDRTAGITPSLLTTISECSLPLPDHELDVNCERTGDALLLQVAFVWDKKQPRKSWNLLTLPTEPVCGIESDDESLPSDVLSLWSLAWNEVQNEARRTPVSKASRLRQPRVPAWIALAINSRDSRTGSQLHIHGACAKQLVWSELDRKYKALAPGSWVLDGFVYDAQLPGGKTFTIHYDVRKILSLDGEDNPFLVVAARKTGDIADHSIAVIAPNVATYYYVLDTTWTKGAPLDSDNDDPSGHAEELLAQRANDPDCGPNGYITPKNR